MSVFERVKKSIEEAKKAIKKAEDLIAFGREAGVDVSKQEARLTRLRDRVRRFEEALKKRGVRT